VAHTKLREGWLKHTHGKRNKELTGQLKNQFKTNVEVSAY